MNKRVGVALAGAVLAMAIAIAAAARAEVLEVTGEFPAPAREASMVRSVTVERFGGEDGAALSIAIERALTGAPFELLGGRTGRANAEASIGGTVATGIEESAVRRTETRCTQKDDKGKCVKEEQVPIACRRRIIDVNAEIRMVRETDGRIVYSASKPVREETEWCERARPDRTAEDVVASALANIAQSVRADITPRIDTYRIRVRESTKGMPKELAARFRALVQQTKRDPEGACRGWQAFDTALPGHPSTLFNLGLCAERGGDYPQAVTLYRAAADAGAVEGREGASRATQLIAGREDARERARR